MDDWDAGGSGDGGFRTGKRQSEKGEVDYKLKAGTAWSHSYLNQKPWHPLSYPNQRRKWIAEQTHVNRERRAEEVAREFSQEQEFFRQTSLFSQKEKEKMEIVKAVSFMYVRPPGYNPESAKAAEIADEKKRSDEYNIELTVGATSCSKNDSKPEHEKIIEEKKSRPKDVFGRPLPTENEFEVLKNAPRLETGMPARVKPFGIEIRNVRCVRCGTFGHQSGDRECPLKDAIMPNDESRLKRDDPLTTIMAQTNSVEPVKWELKQKPGMSPPRGGFQPDDPNQQIVADEIFDEYGGFLSGGEIPALLSNFSTGMSRKHSKNKSKHKHKSSTSRRESNLEYKNHPSSSDSDYRREIKRSKNKNIRLFDHEIDQKKRFRNKHDRPLSEVDHDDRRRSRNKYENSSDSDVGKEKIRSRKKHIARSSDSEDDRDRHLYDRHDKMSSDSEVDRQRKKSNSKCDRSYDIDDDRRTHSLRCKHNRSPDAKIVRKKRRSNGRKKKRMRQRSLSSDSKSSDSTS